VLRPALEKIHPQCVYVQPVLILEELPSIMKQAKILPPVSLCMLIFITLRHTVRGSLVIEAPGQIQNAHNFMPGA